jgi:transposase
MEASSPRYFCGIDWASDHHDVCVLDASGQVCSRFRVSHDAEGLATLCARLRRFSEPAQLGIGLERPSGLLVDFLVEEGFRVCPIHPNQLKATRPRYHASPAKSDGEDAYIAGDMLRTDGHRFPALRAPSDSTRALRAAVRTRDDLVRTRVQLTNQLRALLESFWPGPLALFCELSSAISLAFLESYPTPQSAARLGEGRMSRFLTQHGYSGRKPAAQLLERLRSAAPGRTGPLQEATCGKLVLNLVRVLGTLVAQIRETEKLIAQQLASHEDGGWLVSFPRIGETNAAQIFAELGDDRKRYTSEEHLAAEAGVTPVTKESGRSRGVSFRYGCNKRLRNALTTWADNSRHASAWAADMYRRARARGCSHAHAVRILARAWLRVLWRCWQDQTSYDPAKHSRAAALQSPKSILDHAA